MNRSRITPNYIQVINVRMYYQNSQTLYYTDYGVSGKLLVAVQSLYEDGWARVRVEGGSHHGFRLRVK